MIELVLLHLEEGEHLSVCRYFSWLVLPIVYCFHIHAQPHTHTPHRHSQFRQCLSYLRGEQQWRIVILSPKMSSHDHTCSLTRKPCDSFTAAQVINTTGLHNDYTFCSGLQAQKIDLVHQPHLSWNLGCRRQLLEQLHHDGRRTCQRFPLDVVRMASSTSRFAAAIAWDSIDDDRHLLRLLLLIE